MAGLLGGGAAVPHRRRGGRQALGQRDIRVHPDEGWLEIRLPTPLAHLSNTPGRAPTYRLSCPVAFTHRRGEWAAQAASGAVRYDISLDPLKGGGTGTGRWHLDGSWRLPARPVPSLDKLRQHRSLGVDLNADHLAAWILNPAGNPLGQPHTIPLDLDGQPASTRDGRLRAAVAELLRLAKAHGCRSLTVENLDFAKARCTGRETLGRGRRGKAFRRVVAGMPTRRFRDLLVGMAANQGLWIIAVDPAWTSVWGGRYWQQPLNSSTRRPVAVSRHHAAALVIGRRGLGHRARRRGGRGLIHRRMGKEELPTPPGGPRPLTWLRPRQGLCLSRRHRDLAVLEDSGQGLRPIRPARPNWTPPGTRRPRTVRGHPSAPTDRR